VIHGYTHLRAARDGESLRERITTRFYTAGEGEFFDLDTETAAHLVEQAKEEFREAGFETEGFIAPAWLLSKQAEAGIRQIGCQYTTRLDSVIDLQAGRTYYSQSLVWSVRSAWRRAMSLAWNGVLFNMLRGNPLMRISVHPADVHYPMIWRQIRRCVARALEQRASYTYERWIARQRAIELTTIK
jgi:predicted deacetylase